jgi:hypothetical protein
MADDKFVGRTLARREDVEQRYVGPAGAVFVPHAQLDDETLASKVASGEWTLHEPAKKTASKRSPKK